MPGDDFWFASTKDRLEDMSFYIPDTLDPIRPTDAVRALSTQVDLR